ncbi:hypothetical protein BJV82DRAFT_714896 [Fennellomyces sp. T-0311]|nr:hypothetical protein BJV82DRAFT_714896 [Fennellomyces sp. T-0311]
MTYTKPKHASLLVAHGDTYSRLTMTCLSGPNVASDFFEQGKHAYGSKNYDIAVDSFTRAIEILQQDLSIALLHRAAALEMKHDYDGVMRDSLQANPNNKSTVPDPYFTAANSLLLQDRLREAANHLHTGINIVPSTCMQHPALVQQYQRVATEMDARNQWMANLLPYEILNRVLSLLSPRSCIRLASTCRFWNTYILRKWPGMWSRIDATLHGGDLPDDETVIRRVLMSIPASNVQSVLLNLKDGYDGRKSRMVLGAIIQQRWDKIVYLGVHEPNKKDLRNILYINKDSIRRVELWDGEVTFGSPPRSNYIEEALIDAATVCSSIQSITGHCKSFTQLSRHITPQLQPSDLVLTHFRLSDRFRPFDLLPSGLTAFKFCEQTLNLVNDQYPLLKELSLDTSTPGRGLTATYSRAPADAGLTRLKLNLTDYSEEDGVENRSSLDQHTHTVIQRNSKKLQSLMLPSYDKAFPRGSTLLLEIARIGLPALTNLELSFFDTYSEFGPCNLRNLLAACPALKQALIHGSCIWDTGVLEELSMLGCLEQLDIDMGHCTDISRTMSTDRNELADLVKHNRTLRSFSFGYRCHDAVDKTCAYRKAHPGVLLEVARCAGANPTIHKLDFRNATIACGDELVAVLDSLKNSQIRSLMIKTCCCIEDKQIQAIASLRNISFLTIADRQNKIDKQQLIRIFDEHSGGQGQFVLQAINPSGAGLTGRKQYPVISTDHMEGSSTQKDDSYFTSYYAIRDSYNLRYIKEVALLRPPRASAFR